VQRSHYARHTPPPDQQYTSMLTWICDDRETHIGLTRGPVYPFSQYPSPSKPGSTPPLHGDHQLPSTLPRSDVLPASVGDEVKHLTTSSEAPESRQLPGSSSTVASVVLSTQTAPPERHSLQSNEPCDVELVSTL
jgi:hypothetical protein